MYRIILFSLSICLILNSIAQRKKKSFIGEALIYQDNFESRLDTAAWFVEIAPLPFSKVYTANGKLVLDTEGGVTVWFKKKLKGNIRIEYNRTVKIDSGRNDRLSDLNMFWMANDPSHSNPFGRDGVLESYDSLQLYYAGIGGNNNSTTRFRKYPGNGERTLLQEYKDKQHLLMANKSYHIMIVVKNNTTNVSVDGLAFFDYTDSSILKNGYFGFRSTKSRQVIDNFKVYNLD